MYLSDILFYRNLDLPLKDIKRIFDGLEVEKIGDIIEERKKDAIESIRKYQRILENIEEWEAAYKDELDLIGKYMIGNMPSELRKEGFYDEHENIATYMKSGLKINKEDWINVSLSFYCNLYDQEITMKKYLSVNKTSQTKMNNVGQDIIEEHAEHCIYTQVRYSDHVLDMINPLVVYAKENGYELTGEIYGRENTNYYEKGQRLALYRLYAPIK
jgi:DNA-binding transcriptional MerR regulator